MSFFAQDIWTKVLTNINLILNDITSGELESFLKRDLGGKTCLNKQIVR